MWGHFSLTGKNSRSNSLSDQDQKSLYVLSNVLCLDQTLSYIWYLLCPAPASGRSPDSAFSESWSCWRSSARRNGYSHCHCPGPAHNLAQQLYVLHFLPPSFVWNIPILIVFLQGVSKKKLGLVFRGHLRPLNGRKSKKARKQTPPKIQFYLLGGVFRSVCRL